MAASLPDKDGVLFVLGPQMYGGSGPGGQSLPGPLAYLERTTSNIGGPMGAGGPPQPGRRTDLSIHTNFYFSLPTCFFTSKFLTPNFFLNLFHQFFFLDQFLISFSLFLLFLFPSFLLFALKYRLSKYCPCSHVVSNCFHCCPL